MKSRPILFSGPMVRAILDGHKTQTRRIIKPQPDAVEEHRFLSGSQAGQPYQILRCYNPPARLKPCASGWSVTCPGPFCMPGNVGDQLWVQENHRLRSPIRETKSVECNYDSDGVQKVIPLQSEEWEKMMDRQNQVGPDYGRIIPGRFMYRSFSRITLEITAVRIERLQDISEADANAEGCPMLAEDQNWTQCRDWYRDLWKSINGPDSWGANPYVWVIEFARL